jgi:trk system potassium uptake protein TrkH
VLFVAVAPLAGFGATQPYSAEAATPVQERITPRIRDTVKVLAFVYGGLTLGGVVVLHLVGMGTFEAVNYALSTVSTGGFSTDSDSVGAFDSWAVELAITVGMVLAGTNFAIYYIAARRGVGRAVGNAELITYLGVILASTVLITADLHASDHRDSLAIAFREALFQSALRRSASVGQDHARHLDAPGTPGTVHGPGPAQPCFLAILVEPEERGYSGLFTPVRGRGILRSSPVGVVP